MSARLIALLMAQPPDDGAALDSERGPSGLAVPQAGAAAVIAAVRLLLHGAGHPGAPAPELLLLAEVMVIDEHPSVPDWTATERAEAVGWVAALLDRFGEDGVRELVRMLNIGSTEGP